MYTIIQFNWFDWEILMTKTKFWLLCNWYLSKSLCTKSSEHNVIANPNRSIRCVLDFVSLEFTQSRWYFVVDLLDKCRARFFVSFRKNLGTKIVQHIYGLIVGSMLLFCLRLCWIYRCKCAHAYIVYIDLSISPPSLSICLSLCFCARAPCIVARNISTLDTIQFNLFWLKI